MKIRIAILIVAIVLSLLPLTSFADTYKVGDSFVGFSAADQHGAVNTFKPGDAKVILFDTPSDGGESQHPQDPQWFAKNHALLLINISDFAPFKRRIAASRMESKPFKMLIVDDKAIAGKFPVQTGKFTVLTLDAGGKITSVAFAAPGPDLQKMVEGS
ncbi:MAG: hypothetical protein ACREPX_03985 [Rhodanobacteraceae bacterium]